MENNSNSLAKISLGINLLLIVAVIFLFVRMPGSDASADSDEPVDTTDLTNLREKVRTPLLSIIMLIHLMPSRDL